MDGLEWPKAFTEKGLYMLATILKSRQATITTLMIIETFAKIRELSRTVKALSEPPEGEAQRFISAAAAILARIEQTINAV